MDAFLSHVRKCGLSEAQTMLLARNYSTISQVRHQADLTKPRSGGEQLHILLEGWACKYRLLPNGRRQVLAILLPGDVCDLDRIFDDTAAFGVAALTPCRVATLSLGWIKRMLDDQVEMRELFWSMVLHENMAMVEQVVSLGRRTARERTAYLLCDLLDRLQQRGEALDGRFRMPLTQADMADHLGLSTVHVNRTLQDLKAEGLVESGGRTYHVCKPDILKRVAGYVRLPPHRAGGVLAPLGTIAALRETPRQHLHLN